MASLLDHLSMLGNNFFDQTASLNNDIRSLSGSDKEQMGTENNPIYTIDANFKLMPTKLDDLYSFMRVETAPYYKTMTTYMSRSNELLGSLLSLTSKVWDDGAISQDEILNKSLEMETKLQESIENMRLDYQDTMKDVQDSILKDLNNVKDKLVDNLEEINNTIDTSSQRNDDNYSSGGGRFSALGSLIKGALLTGLNTLMGVGVDFLHHAQDLYDQQYDRVDEIMKTYSVSFEEAMKIARDEMTKSGIDIYRRYTKQQEMERTWNAQREAINLGFTSSKELNIASSQIREMNEIMPGLNFQASELYKTLIHGMDDSGKHAQAIFDSIRDASKNLMIDPETVLSTADTFTKYFKVLRKNTLDFQRGMIDVIETTSKLEDNFIDSQSAYERAMDFGFTELSDLSDSQIERYSLLARYTDRSFMELRNLARNNINEFLEIEQQATKRYLEDMGIEQGGELGERDLYKMGFIGATGADAIVNELNYGFADLNKSQEKLVENAGIDDYTYNVNVDMSEDQWNKWNEMFGGYFTPWDEKMKELNRYILDNDYLRKINDTLMEMSYGQYGIGNAASSISNFITGGALVMWLSAILSAIGVNKLLGSGGKGSSILGKGAKAASSAGKMTLGQAFATGTTTAGTTAIGVAGTAAGLAMQGYGAYQGVQDYENTMNFEGFQDKKGTSGYVGKGIGGFLGRGAFGTGKGIGEGTTKEVLQNMGSNALGFGTVGAGIGTLVLPGIGTAVGGAIGAIVGATLGAIGEDKIAEAFMSETDKNNYFDAKAAKEAETRNKLEVQNIKSNLELADQMEKQGKLEWKSINELKDHKKALEQSKSTMDTTNANLTAQEIAIRDEILSIDAQTQQGQLTTEQAALLKQQIYDDMVNNNTISVPAINASVEATNKYQDLLNDPQTGLITSVENLTGSLDNYSDTFGTLVTTFYNDKYGTQYSTLFKLDRTKEATQKAISGYKSSMKNDTSEFGTLVNKLGADQIGNFMDIAYNQYMNSGGKDALGWDWETDTTKRNEFITNAVKGEIMNGGRVDYNNAFVQETLGGSGAYYQLDPQVQSYIYKNEDGMAQYYNSDPQIPQMSLAGWEALKASSGSYIARTYGSSSPEAVDQIINSQKVLPVYNEEGNKESRKTIIKLKDGTWIAYDPGAAGFGGVNTVTDITGEHSSTGILGTSWSSEIDPERDPGIHKGGLSRVPYDNYRALLHKDERVLTAQENRAYTSMITNSLSEDQYDLSEKQYTLAQDQNNLDTDDFYLSEDQYELNQLDYKLNSNQYAQDANTYELSTEIHTVLQSLYDSLNNNSTGLIKKISNLGSHILNLVDRVKSNTSILEKIHPSLEYVHNTLGYIMEPEKYQDKFDLGTDTGSEGSDFGGAGQLITKGENPYSGWTITSRFGPRSLMGRSFHYGTDYAAPSGTPIPAPATGVITVNGYDGDGYGNWVEMEGDNGYRFRFGHMVERSDVKVGDRVRYGDIIGKVGSTGVSTGPHLHFEVRRPSDTGGWEAFDDREYWGTTDAARGQSGYARPTSLEELFSVLGLNINTSSNYKGVDLSYMRQFEVGTTGPEGYRVVSNVGPGEWAYGAYQYTAKGSMDNTQSFIKWMNGAGFSDVAQLLGNGSVSGHGGALKTLWQSTYDKITKRFINSQDEYQYQAYAKPVLDKYGTVLRKLGPKATAVALGYVNWMGHGGFANVINRMGDNITLQSFIDAARGRIRSLSNYSTFKNGWENRLNADARYLGVHRTGLSYVPYDGYSAVLHHGEAILPASEAEIYRTRNLTAFESVAQQSVPEVNEVYVDTDSVVDAIKELADIVSDGFERIIRQSEPSAPAMKSPSRAKSNSILSYT